MLSEMDLYYCLLKRKGLQENNGRETPKPHTPPGSDPIQSK